MVTDDLTLKEMKEIRQMFAGGSPCAVDNGPWQLGEKYLIRTVTMTLTGRLESVGKQELVLSSAAWIASTGRYADAVRDAKFDEIEPYPDGKEVVVGRAAVIDAVTIPSLPREQK